MNDNNVIVVVASIYFGCMFLAFAVASIAEAISKTCP
jgi:hypothetical protein